MRVTAEPLKFLTADVANQLALDIAKNLDRYREGNFVDLAQQAGWAIETKFAKWDPEIAHQLDPAGSTDAEIRNSLLIYKGLEDMTPALAREERLWTRLCHIECLEYARQRWLKETGDLQQHVRLHFFAPSLPGCRDDNAIGRLWWNGYVASIASPDDIELGLRRLLARANIRLQIIDRADTAFRQPLMQGIFRLLGRDPWFNSSDVAVADFMFEVNKRSGGIIFEALEDAAIDDHLDLCLGNAKQRKVAA
jgi:uncharacterized protein DUF6339